MLTDAACKNAVSVWPYHLDGDLQLRPAQASSD